MSQWTNIKEATSQLIAVCLYRKAEPDEMLSSYAWRTKNAWLISCLDWLFGKGHCQESYEWEREHYNVERFKNG